MEGSEVYLVFRQIVNVFAGALLVITLILSLVGFYYFGYVKGYNAAVSIIGTEYVSLVSEEGGLEALPTVAPVPEGSSPIKATPTMSPGWGGPELWSAVNERRVEFGVNPLSQRDELCTIASIRLNELLALGTLDGHEGFTNLKERRSDLEWIFEKYSNISEFLALGGQTPEETVSMWENTLGHKKLMTGGEYVWGCIYAQNTFAVAITAY